MSEGRRRLLSVLQCMRGREVAARVRVHRSNVSRWASGEWAPCSRARRMLEQHVGIPAEFWDRRAVNRQQLGV